MLKWSEVENLPKDHPKMIQFIKEQEWFEAAEAAEAAEEVEGDESSLEYFDRYIAGDRK